MMMEIINKTEEALLLGATDLQYVEVLTSLYMVNNNFWFLIRIYSYQFRNWIFDETWFYVIQEKEKKITNNIGNLPKLDIICFHDINCW